MNIFIFIHSLSSGGAERVTANLANHWANKGEQVTVVTLANKSLDFYQLAPAVKRISLDLAADSGNLLFAIVNNLRRVLVLRRLLRRVQPDIALGMMTTANLLLAMASFGIDNLATIGSERSHPPQYQLGRIWEGLRRMCYGQLTAVAVLTNESRAWLLQHTRATKVVVIPNAAHWPLAVQPPILPVKNYCNLGRNILLAVGRLSEEKNIELLLNIFKRLVLDYPAWDLVILGEGPQRSLLEQNIEKLGLQQRVRMPGRVGNVADWYAAANLYVMCSRFEGFPNSLAEAMAHGLPAVSFDCDTGPRDIIRDEVDGVLVANGDVIALEKALSRLMADEALRLQFGVKATEARERFSMVKIIAMWEQFFEEVKQRD